MSNFTLNLKYPEKSIGIQFKISKFPDGQQDVTITNVEEIEKCSYHRSVTIKSTLSSFKDLELIICATASLKRLKFKEIHLYVPYIIGARSDRKFVEGGNSYVKDVIAPIINSQNYESVTCIDPHSDVLEACIDRLEIINNNELFSFALKNYFIEEKNLDQSDFSKFILVSPDAGSMKKIYKLSDFINYKGDIVVCSKHRDENGKLSKTIVPITSEQHTMLHKGPYKDFFIIDDICDGGRTFINIAKEIKEYFHESGCSESNIYLVVTHGIFSAGLYELSKYFKRIYCTNSFSDVNVLEHSDYTVEENFVKQLNVY
jgi:ribose-phosphate pyrophosphokinase